MQKYLIIYVDLQGGERQTYITASSKEGAILKFENQYAHESIKYCEDDI